ncbi:Cochaperone protein [Sorochytrium milnesiophthora]
MSAASSTTAASEQQQQQQRVRYEWFQSPTDVVVSVFIKGLNKQPHVDKVRIDFSPRTLSVTCPLPTSSAGSEYSLELDLAHAIDPSQSSFEVLSTKIEVKMRKVDDGLKWNVLEGEDTDVLVAAAAAVPSTGAPTRVYPSSSKHGPKNWDKLDKEAATDESDKPEGEAALNALFQQIYADASEESNGTCLSTNWSEVGKGKVETKPPDGMAAKNWNQ